jgi:threonine synthase
MFEQLAGRVPDFIAVPTSTCGHIRGIFKGYQELLAAGLVDALPRMIIVQAANNSPLVTALREGRTEPVPFTNFHTVAEAITTGNPAGGNEILAKAYEHGWLAADVTESEIVDSQRRLARAGFFVEPSSATSLEAVRKLRTAGEIGQHQTVVLMLTGSGLGGLSMFDGHHELLIEDSTLTTVETDLEALLHNMR